MSERIAWSATPTPFLADGALDEGALERLVAQHLALGVTGLFLCGTCGEGPFMPTARRSEVARAARRLAGGRLTLSVQVSDTSAARVRENILAMQDCGVDAVVLAPPFLSGLANRDFLRRYFFEPLESVTVPVGIYVRPPAENRALDLDLWREIIRHPKVRIIKDSSGSAEYIVAFAAIRRARPELRVLTGNEFDVASAVAGGYDGFLAGSGILNGLMLRRLMEALDAGKRAEADAWQERNNRFLRDLFRPDISGWMGGLKYALRRLGIFSTEYSHLVYPLTDEDRRRIDAALERERELVRPPAA